MKIRNVWFITALIAFIALSLSTAVSGPARAGEDPARAYGGFRARLMAAYNAKEFDKAAEMIEAAYDSFPGQEWKMSYNMAVVCAHLEDYDRGIEYLERAHDKGQWFSSFAFTGDLWAPYREKDRFKEILDFDLKKKEEAQKTAKMKVEVVVPEGIEEGRRYPLFIALHGGGENIEEFRPNWRSGVMESEFIIAYVQSSQVVSMTGFSWEEQEKTRDELSRAYADVCGAYPVDTTEVIIGGFSSGGFGSLVATFFEAVPVQGFIILCPPMPENITGTEAAAARDRGVRGTIITTELDRRVPDQRRMADLFRDTGLQYQFILLPNMGHWYPDNLGELIDQAIAHIRNR